MTTLARQILIERVLELWHGGQHDTLAIAVALGVVEAEVCHIIEEFEERRT